MADGVVGTFEALAGRNGRPSEGRWSRQAPHPKDAARAGRPQQQWGISRSMAPVCCYTADVMMNPFRNTRPGTAIVIVVCALISATGCWEAGEPSKSTPEVRANLEALGYVETLPVDGDGTETPVGVTRHDVLRSMAGLNLFTPRHLARAELLGMDGRLIHHWELDDGAPWQHVELCADGGLLAYVKDRELLRLAPDSTVRWRVHGRFHHDVTLTQGGDIWAPTRRVEIVELHGREIPLLVDFMAFFTGGGDLVREISLFDLFGAGISSSRVESIQRWTEENEILDRLAEVNVDEVEIVPADSPPDVFHLNSIEPIHRNIPGVCRVGDLLISVRNLNMVAVVDPTTLEVRWTWGPGELEMQHHATQLDSGHFLIFDNGVRRGASRIVEVSPSGSRIVWQYRGTDSHPFFSALRGSAQRLANGNTLIAETDAGRAFEVTAEGETVWELWTPLLGRPEKGKTRRAVYYRVIRITDSAYPGLKALGLSPEGFRND